MQYNRVCRKGEFVCDDKQNHCGGVPKTGREKRKEFFWFFLFITNCKKEKDGQKASASRDNDRMPVYQLDKES